MGTLLAMVGPAHVAPRFPGGSRGARSPRCLGVQHRGLVQAADKEAKMLKTRPKVRQLTTAFEILDDEQRVVETVHCPNGIWHDSGQSYGHAALASRRWFLRSYCRPRHIDPDFNVNDF